MPRLYDQRLERFSASMHYYNPNSRTSGVTTVRTKNRNSMLDYLPYQFTNMMCQVDDYQQQHHASSSAVMVEEEIPTPKSSRKRNCGSAPSQNAFSNVKGATVSSSSPTTATTIPKPFFIMDWLDEVDPQDLELARKILQRGGSRSVPSNLQNANHTSFSSSQEGNDRKVPTTPIHRSASVDSGLVSPFKVKSIAIGNGWNAKGLAKAKYGKWEAALLCWENALEIRSQVLGDTHVDVANTHNNMGIALGKLGRYTKAMEHLEYALDIRLDAYGELHPEIATTLHNIGNIFHQSRDWVAAIQCFGDAKRILEQVLGYDHVQVGRACNAIGHVYYEAGQYDDALEAMSDALGIFERAGLLQDDEEVQITQKDIQDLTSILTCT